MTIELGNRLADLRKEHGYSQEELAEKLGVSRQAISKWERGEASPDTDNLIELAKIYGISLDELVGLNTESTSKDDKDDDDRITIDKTGIHLEDEDGEVHIDSTGVYVNSGKDKDKDKVKVKWHSKEDPKSRVMSFVSVFTVFGTVIAYILLGFLLNLWGQAWVLFLLIPVVPSIVESIVKKNIYIFVYPVFIAFVYLLLCVWVFNFNYFHPLWVMFLTIPIYYPTIRLFFRKKDHEE